MNNQPSVLELWKRLNEMESEKRFDRQSYPPGMVALPFRLTGQGFFPGGDGLWRDDSQLEMPSSGLLPSGGIVFVGNDFGTLKSYQSLKNKGYENPPTWRNVKERVRRAGLPPQLTFFTNAVMGLRGEGKALDKKSWTSMPGFPEFCREFFLFQIEMLQPRLLVLLGPEAKFSFSKLTGTARENGVASIVKRRLSVFSCTHPYGDFNFTEQRKKDDAAELKRAWQSARELGNMVN